MPFYPTLPAPGQSRLETNIFRGYDHRLRIPDGAFYDTENLSLDDYPMIGTRALRGTVTAVSKPGGCICKDAMIRVDGSKVYVGETAVELGLNDTRPKQLISMGAYLVIFPDKKYLNTADLTDFGSLEATWTGTNVSYSICNEAGAAYENVTSQQSAPKNPANGDYWIDRATNTMKQYSASAGMWVEIPTVCTKIAATGIGKHFAQYDGVTLTGIDGSQQLFDLNGTRVIQSRTDNAIVVVGLLYAPYEQTDSLVTVARTVPDLDYVCEAGNRLWGCKYGVVNRKPVNELYACKLGDFKNWNCFQGLSTDSWAASVGSDGKWTAAVNYLGCPTFFKENRIHRVYPDGGGAHQVVETVCSGVESGSWRSACVAGELLCYKGRNGVYVYDGGLPVKISESLGDVRYSDAVAGAIGGTYYISMLDAAGKSHLFTYDIEKGIWCREDDLRAVMFAEKDGDLWCQTEHAMLTMRGTVGTPETDIQWTAISGIQHYEDPGNKYLGRYGFRLKLWDGATVRLWIRYDSEDLWYDQGTFEAVDSLFTSDAVCSRTLPVIPRRCDHLQFKLEGTGRFRLFQISRTYEAGSDAG